MNICPEICKKVVIRQVFVKTTYSQWPGNHFEYLIGSDMKFLNCRVPQTVIWGKIGGFHFKSPYRVLLMRKPRHFYKKIFGMHWFQRCNSWKNSLSPNVYCIQSGLEKHVFWGMKTLVKLKIMLLEVSTM